jgi:glucose dehydrogenase
MPDGSASSGRPAAVETAVRRTGRRESHTGDIAWRVPFGDTPSVRRHPALAGVTLPARLGATGVGGVIVTASGLVIGAGGDAALYAFDASDGREIARFDLGRAASSTPMTYRSASGRQFVVIASVRVRGIPRRVRRPAG